VGRVSSKGTTILVFIIGWLKGEVTVDLTLKMRDIILSEDKESFRGNTVTEKNDAVNTLSVLTVYIRDKYDSLPQPNPSLNSPLVSSPKPLQRHNAFSDLYQQNRP
jgi:hypothetical protein